MSDKERVDASTEESNAQNISRRTFLGGAALSAAFLGVTGMMTRVPKAQAAPTPAAARPPIPARGPTKPLREVAAAQPPGVFPEIMRQHAFSLSDVAMGEGVYDRAFQEQLSMGRACNIDSMLATFRRTAGLDEKGARPPGGWDGFQPSAQGPQDWGPEEYDDWCEANGRVGSADGLLRGHYSGHFLSMLAMGYAGTGEAIFKEKVDYMVDGLKECQDALAKMTYNGKPRYSHPGFLSAYGEWQFSALERIARYGEIWAPYYTLHKILDGLLAAYKFVGNETALEVAEGIGRWVHSRLSKLSNDQRQKMWDAYIAGECGGMNDVLVELYWQSKSADKDVFLDAAKLFDFDNFLDACAAGRDTLNGKHANQYIPTYVGYAKLYEATEDERYLNGVKGFFDMCVPGRVYPHGGIGKGEMFGPPGATTTNLSERNAESCAAFNLTKVAWHLFLITGEQKYIEYCERTVLNHLLGGRRDYHSTTVPYNLYMFPTNPGARKEFGGGQLGTCCGGSGLEISVRFQETVYARAKTGDIVYVNQYMATTLNWEEKGLRLRQTTDYPRDNVATFTFEEAPSESMTLSLRIPAWATGTVELQVNGNDAGVETKANTYASITREWKKGDIVTLKLPLVLRVEKALDSDTLSTLFYGPAAFVMLGTESAFPKVSLAGGKDLSGSFEKGFTWDKELTGHGRRVNFAGRVFDPLYAGQHNTYHMYMDVDERTVVFAGKDTAVANPRRNGRSLVDEIWDSAPFATRAEFLEAVRVVTESYVNEGLLTPRNRQKILLTASQARIEGK